MPVVKTEKRFREGTGERFMADGQRVRCQSQSKNQLREWRIKHQDYTTPNDAIWPHCQCIKAAVPGMFACHLHGGLTPSKDKPTSLLDLIPLDLGEKYRTMLENPEYMSSREDVMLMKLRQWELVSQLSEEVGDKENWMKVVEAAKLLADGELVRAEALLQSAITTRHNKEEVWKKIYELEAVIKELRSTESKIAKDLHMMASADQVQHLMNRIVAVVLQGIDKYVESPTEQTRFIQHVVTEFASLVNLSPATVGGLLSAGTREEV